MTTTKAITVERYQRRRERYLTNTCSSLCNQATPCIYSQSIVHIQLLTTVTLHALKQPKLCSQRLFPLSMNGMQSVAFRITAAAAGTALLSPNFTTSIFLLEGKF